jgi:hypothetical protein
LDFLNERDTQNAIDIVSSGWDNTILLWIYDHQEETETNNNKNKNNSKSKRKIQEISKGNVQSEDNSVNKNKISLFFFF